MDNWRERLRTALRERGISQTDFSARIGKSPSYIKVLLFQRTDPAVSTFVTMADALDVPVEWLLFGVEADPTLALIARRFSQLSDTQKAAVLTLIESMTGQDAADENA